MMLTDDELANLKRYCKIDHNFDDEVLKMIIESVEVELVRAISYTATPADFAAEPRFKIALMKKVKEEYYFRGLTADSRRKELALGVDNIISQLRSEMRDGDDLHDGTDHPVLSIDGD